MAIPGLTLQIRDPGLGLVGPSVSTPLVLGTSSSGTVNTIVSISDQGDLVDEFGEGPLTEDAGRMLSLAGGPILCMRATGGVAGAAGAVTKTAAASGTGTITVAGAPYDAYQARVTIVAAGALGVATFTYSLDNGNTTSDVITVPSGGTFAIPRTNLTLTFVPGSGTPTTYDAGDLHTFTCTAPAINATNLGDAMTAALATSRLYRFAYLAGRHGDATASATLGAAAVTHMATAQGQKRYTAFLMDAGSDVAATTITAFAAVAGARNMFGFGSTRRSSVKPFAGWSTPTGTAAAEVAARLAADLISTHAGRVASGPLPGLVSITHDERTAEGMDAAGFATLRTHQGLPGFYVTRGRIKAAAGSDFQRAELRFVMDVACTTAVEALTTQINKALRVLTDGTGRIDPRDAATWRAVVMRALRARLTEPLNAEGFAGHVSDLDVTVNQSNNVLTSGQVLVTVAIVSLGYAETIAIDVGYAQAL